MRRLVPIVIIVIAACGPDNNESSTNNNVGQTTPNSSNNSTVNAGTNSGTTSGSTNNESTNNGSTNNANTNNANTNNGSTNNSSTNNTANNTTTNNGTAGCTDPQEPNDVKADAHPATSGDTFDGRICNIDDLDLFSIDLTSGQTLTASAEFPAATDNLDLTLFDAAQAEEIARSDLGIAYTFETGVTPEVLTHTVEADGTYYLLIFNNNETEAAYTLSLEVQ